MNESREMEKEAAVIHLTQLHNNSITVLATRD
jgi:hypothetical protein